MDSSSVLCGNKPREHSIESYVTKHLGYCCEWFFFELFKDAELTSIRLGISLGTVRRHMLWKKRGLVQCTGCDKCVKNRESSNAQATD